MRFILIFETISSVTGLTKSFYSTS